MLDLYGEIDRMSRATNTYGWATSDDELVCDPKNAAKPIGPRQWLEAMRVACALHPRAAIQRLGAPEPVAHPSGRAGLTWHDGEKVWFTAIFAPGSCESRFSAEWERRDERGTVKGTSDSLRDVAEALESAFSSSRAA